MNGGMSTNTRQGTGGNSMGSEAANTVRERLQERMSREGLLTYEAFLETVLYDPDVGYYRAGKQERLDYLTSPELHALFGATIGRYIEGICDSLHIGSPTILELGGASGRLASDVLSGLTRLSPALYLILEKGEERQQGIIRWVNDLRHAEIPLGFVFVIANEFFDALPFHRIINVEGALREIYIGHDEGFFEQTGELSAPVSAFLDRYPVALHEGQTLEVTPRSAEIAAQLAAVTGQSCWLVFDYGYHQSDIVAGRFMTGSILAYHRWNIHENVFDNLGEMDITHHVNFDHLSAVLGAQGWKKEGETEQYRFLYNAGIFEQVSRLPADRRMSAMSVLNPEGIGSMISALGFSRGLSIPMPGFTR